MAWMPGRRRPAPAEHWICSLDSARSPAQQFIDFSQTVQFLLAQLQQAGVICHAWSLSKKRLELVIGLVRHGNMRDVLNCFLEDCAVYWQQQYCLPFELDAVRFSQGFLRSDSDLLRAMQSVEMAPLKDSRLRDAQDYPYSSCLWHTKGEPDPLVVDPMAYVRLGIDARSRQFVYQEQLAQQCADPLQSALHEELALIKRERRKAQRRI